LQAYNFILLASSADAITSLWHCRGASRIYLTKGQAMQACLSFH